MVGSVALFGGGIAVALFGYGGYRIATFVQGIRRYREQAKADWVAAPAKFLTLLDGSAKDDLRFFRINDQVMGGKSTSALAVASASSGGLVFDGVINTNGGGFASCRTLGDEAPLGLAAGTSSVILVDATGDGQLHKLMLHTADSWQMSTPSWAHDFLTSEKRATYKLPLADFIPSKQGRPVSGAQLDGSGVTGIGFSLSLYTADGKPNPNFGDGPFRLQVHSVREIV